MFWNIYSKRVIGSLRHKETLIWTWIFPILLATMFYAVFTNLDTVNMLHTIPMGLVDGAADPVLAAAAEASGLFELTVFAGTEEADAVLASGEIDGYIILTGGTPALAVTDNGLNQTVTKGFLDRYLQMKQSGVFAAPEVYTKEVSLSANPPTEKVNYFYALLSMICLYGGFQGLTTVTYLQANLSALGARNTMAPVGRFRLVTYNLLGGVTMQYLCLLVVVAYITFVLGVDFGSQILPVLLTCLAGSILGVAFGALVSVTSKLKEQAKVGVLITVTMVCSFLSGMMVGGINYTVAQKAPLAAWLNPAARLTDAFYCLYYYDGYERYLQNIIVILIMSVVMFAVTALFVRRTRYESI